MLTLIIVAVILYFVFTKFFSGSTDNLPTETQTDALPNPTKAAWETLKQGTAPAIVQVKHATEEAKLTYRQTANDRQVAELMKRLNQQMADKAAAGEVADGTVSKDDVLSILADLNSEESAS